MKQDLYRKVGQLFESVFQDSSKCYFGSRLYARIVRVHEETFSCPDNVFCATEEFAIWNRSVWGKEIYKDDLPMKRDQVKRFRKEFFRPCTEERLAERLSQVK